MHRTITQRELRNESGSIMRALDAGDAFVITRTGVPVGELTPARRATFTAKEAVLTAFQHAPQIDGRRFRADVDAILEQRIDPRV